MKQLTDNLNALAKQRDFIIKVTYDHKSWWFNGVSLDVQGGIEASLTLIDNDEVTDSYPLTKEELAFIALDVLAQAQVSLD